MASGCAAASPTLAFAAPALAPHRRRDGGSPFWRYLPPHDRTQPRGAAPPHLRHHFPPRRRQDDADRKAPPLLGRDPDRRLREGEEGFAPRDLRLDGDREAA